MGGVDGEVMGRMGVSPKRALPGDSGWIGLAQAPDTDTFVGLTDKGSLYLVACSL